MAHIFVISDATGATAARVVQAALTQFEAAEFEIIRYGQVRSPSRIRDIIQEAVAVDGFIVHTLVSQELRHLILTHGRSHNIITIDLMGPLLARLSEMLSIQPKSEPGLFHSFDEAYLQRIEAIDFTVRHDDGLNSHELDQAEIVLTGVSRTSKTPVSIFLANRGWKVANVPIALGVEPPALLFQLPKRRVVALTINPARLAEFRKIRATHLGIRPGGYADLDHVRQEVAYALEIFDKRRDWPIVDVTSKQVEETAAEVIGLINPVPD